MEFLQKFRLQTHLPERAPRLLAYGIATGGVLVSDAAPDGVPVSDAARPVGYLLAVGVTFDRCPTDGIDGSAPVVAPDAPPAPPGGAHLAELVVAPDFRREGRATALLTVLLDVADGPVTVAVHPENDAALALYRSLGFESVGRRENYFEAAPARWLVRR